MQLEEVPTECDWPATHFVFVEKLGLFADTAKAAWMELHQQLPALHGMVQITRKMSMYKIDPHMVYRAGVAVSAKPDKCPAGLQYEFFTGGTYHCFLLKGPYAQLPQASSRVFELLKEARFRIREDWYIEHYVNDPTKTPQEELITEILVPGI